MFLAQAKAVVQDCKVNVDQRLASSDEESKMVAICDTTRLASASRREEPVKYPCLAGTDSVCSPIEQ